MARLLERVPDAWVSVSVTTRLPRVGEVDGVQYRFVTEEEFQHLVDTDGLLEYATYNDNRYGTPRALVEEHMARGEQVILEIEIQGAFQVRDRMPEAHLVFIEPPSLEILERRLRKRGTESDDVIESRMRTARVELSHKMEYDMRLINDDLDEATAVLVDYVNEQAEKTRG